MNQQEVDQLLAMKQRCETLRQAVETIKVLCDQQRNYLSENMDSMDLATRAELLNQQQNNMRRYSDAMDEWVASVDAMDEWAANRKCNG